MTGNLTTSGDIEARDLVATTELHVDGAAFLNGSLQVGGAITLNNSVTAKNAVTISGGRGNYNTGGALKIVGTGDLVYNPSSLSFGGYGFESHIFELSWLGYAISYEEVLPRLGHRQCS